MLLSRIDDRNHIVALYIYQTVLIWSITGILLYITAGATIGLNVGATGIGSDALMIPTRLYVVLNTRDTDITQTASYYWGNSHNNGQCRFHAVWHNISQPPASHGVALNDFLTSLRGKCQLSQAKLSKQQHCPSRILKMTY